MQSSEKIKTGIEGLDVLLKGGLPSGRGVLLIGGPGTGKTVMLTEFIYRGITKVNQNGVFVTFEERPWDIIQNMTSFGWDLAKLVKQKKLSFIDASPRIDYEEISYHYELTPLLERIKYAVKNIGAKRVVIDGIGHLFDKFTNKKIIREIIYAISDELKKMDVSFMISAEQLMNSLIYTVEEYVSDGVINMTSETFQNQTVRSIEIIKVRGSSYIDGKTTFEINQNGLTIFPKIQLKEFLNKLENNNRCEFGIPELDEALGGGLPEGSITVLIGETGTGRTTLTNQFIGEGLKKKQNGLYISFKDNIKGFEKVSRRLGWDIQKHIKNKQFKFITTNEYPDKLVYTITDEIKKINAKRVVIDSIDFIDPISLYPHKVADFYLTIMQWLKNQGITCIMTIMPAKNDIEDDILFTDKEVPLRRIINAMPDGIIRLQYYKNNNQIEKKFNIIKMRHNDHQKKFFNYNVDQKGFHFERTKK